MTRILYVEDNVDNVYMLKKRLERKGYTVFVAEDGQQALDMVTKVAPSLVLMDLSLPVLDGWETTRRLKSRPETSGIPVIALSAHAMSGDREKALAAGCNEYETKPVEFQHLLSKIKQLISSAPT